MIGQPRPKPPNRCYTTKTDTWQRCLSNQIKCIAKLPHKSKGGRLPRMDTGHQIAGHRKPKSDEPYRFENGELYVPPDKEPPPFIPDNGFDGPA